MYRFLFSVIIIISHDSSQLAVKSKSIDIVPTRKVHRWRITPVSRMNQSQAASAPSSPSTGGDQALPRSELTTGPELAIIIDKPNCDRVPLTYFTQ